MINLGSLVGDIRIGVDLDLDLLHFFIYFLFSSCYCFDVGGIY